MEEGLVLLLLLHSAFQSPLFIVQHLIDLPDKFQQALRVLLFGGCLAEFTPALFILANHDAPSRFRLSCFISWSRDRHPKSVRDGKDWMSHFHEGNVPGTSEDEIGHARLFQAVLRHNTAARAAVLVALKPQRTGPRASKSRRPFSILSRTYLLAPSPLGQRFQLHYPPH